MKTSYTRALRSPAFGLVVTAAAIMLSTHAWAGSSSLPWDTPLTNIEEDLTGPVAKVGGVIAIVVFGLGFAFSENGGAIRKALGIVFGLSIAFAASSWGLTFFGFSGGAIL